MIEDWWIPLYNWIGLYKIPLYNANQPLTQAHRPLAHSMVSKPSYANTEIDLMIQQTKSAVSNTEYIKSALIHTVH